MVAILTHSHSQHMKLNCADGEKGMDLKFCIHPLMVACLKSMSAKLSPILHCQQLPFDQRIKNKTKQIFFIQVLLFTRYKKALAVLTIQ